MLGTDFRHGSPIWLDLTSPDTERARAFYGAVFDWRFVSAGPEAGGYGFLQQDGETVAALGPPAEQDAEPAWTTYFRSDDVRATARTVAGTGGGVRLPPTNMGGGLLARFTDPQGARFAVLQCDRGLQRTSRDGTLLWTELHTADPEAAIHFYGTLFGWRHEEMSAPGLAYRVLSVRDGEQAAGAFGGVAPLQGEPAAAAWVPYFAVADPDATEAAVRANGGGVVMSPQDLPGVGRVAWLRDPAGAVFAVLKPDPNQT